MRIDLTHPPLPPSLPLPLPATTAVSVESGAASPPASPESLNCEFMLTVSYIVVWWWCFVLAWGVLDGRVLILK